MTERALTPLLLGSRCHLAGFPRLGKTYDLETDERFLPAHRRPA